MTSLVVPIVATVLNPLMPLAAVAALVFLIAAIYALAKGRILAGLVRFLLFCGFGWLTIVSAPIVPPRYESGAIGDCRAVSSSEVAYSSSNNGSFGSLSCLGTPTGCGWPSGTTPFLDSQLASLQPKQGYARSFVSGPTGSGKPDRGIASFVYVATPVTVGNFTNRGFAVDHTGLICFTTDGSVPPIVNGALSPTCTPLK